MSFLFADDTKMYRVIESFTADCDKLQSDINKLFDWSCKWSLKFHPDKCKVMSVNPRQNTTQDYAYVMPDYEGGTVQLKYTESEKDIGVTFQTNMCFGVHIQGQVNKANQIVGLIRRSFRFLDSDTFVLLFKALVRPHLEYACSVWCPHFKKDIDLLENVQRRASKMLPGLREKSYEERLRTLKLPTLRYRRLRGDMIEVYKICHEIYDRRVTGGFLPYSDNVNTRGNSFKLAKRRCRLDIRKFSFAHRVVNIWNDLSDHIVTSNNVNTFKNRLDAYWSHQPVKFNHDCDYVYNCKA